MTNKLVVIVSSLKVPKIKKIWLCEMKFLVPNYRCLQNPWPGGCCPQIPVFSVLCLQLNLLNPPPLNKIPGYATVSNSWSYSFFSKCCRKTLYKNRRNYSVMKHEREMLSLCVCIIALVIRLTKRISSTQRHIVICGLSGSNIFLHIIS